MLSLIHVLNCFLLQGAFAGKCYMKAGMVNPLRIKVRISSTISVVVSVLSDHKSPNICCLLN